MSREQGPFSQMRQSHVTHNAKSQRKKSRQQSRADRLSVASTGLKGKEFLANPQSMRSRCRKFHFVVLSCDGVRSKLLHCLPPFASHPVHQHAEDTCIRLAVIVPLCQRPFKILGGKLEDVVSENEKSDEIEQETRRRDQFPRVVVRKAVFSEHDGGLRRHQRDEQRRDLESVQVLEALAVGHRQDLRHDGEGDEVRDASDRNHAVVEVRAEHQKRDDRLAHDDGHFPVAARTQSVAAVEETHRLVGPAVLLDETLGRSLEEDDEEDQQSTVDRAHERQDQVVEQLRVVALVTLDRRIHRPVHGRALVLEVVNVVHVDAEADAQCGLQHRHKRDVPQDHQG